MKKFNLSTLRNILVLSLFVFFVPYFVSDALACHITFEKTDSKDKQETIKVGEDGTVVFNAVVKWEHRKCVLADDDVNIDYNGVEKIYAKGWKKIKRGLYKNEIKVKLIDKEGTVRIWRECSKKGLSEGIVKITK